MTSNFSRDTLIRAIHNDRTLFRRWYIEGLFNQLTTGILLTEPSFRRQILFHRLKQL